MEKYIFPENSGIAYNEDPAKLVTEVVNKISEIFENQNLTNKTISVGFDTRRESLNIAEDFSKLMYKRGFKILLSKKNIPTPALKYFTSISNSQVGIMFTGGDLKEGWFGCKLHNSNSEAVNYLELNSSNKNYAIGTGEIIYFDMFQTYLDYLKKAVDFQKIKNYGDKHNSTDSLLVDSLGGSGETIIEDLISEQNWRVQTLFGTPIENFYDRIPKISREQMETISYNVSQTDAVLGIALNGDCSEAGFVNEKGEIVDKIKILNLLKEHFNTNSEKIINQIYNDGILTSLIILEIISSKGKEILF